MNDIFLYIKILLFFEALMRLLELNENHKLTVQLLLDEQKIEFFSYVIEKNDFAVYVTPYIHNGNELEINVTPENGVICNLFTDNPYTNKRISWKNVELTTVVRNGKTMYCLKTNGYNHMAIHDDRRKHERIVIHTKAQVFDGKSEEGIGIIVHDISDIGISFYAPKNFSPNDYQLTVAFTDNIGDKSYDVKVECAIARTLNKAGNLFVGCKITKENKNYQFYCFMKHLESKNKDKA